MMNKKRWLAAVLSVMMVLAYMPAMSFAADVLGAAVNADGVVTWNMTDKDGVPADNYLLKLQKRPIGGSDADWLDNNYTGGGLNNGEKVVNKADPFVFNLKAALKDAPEGEYRVKISARDNANVVFAGPTVAAGPAVVKGAAAGELGTVQNLALLLDQEAKWDDNIGPAQIAPTSYKVELYRAKAALAAGATVVPSTAEKLGEVVTVGVRKADLSGIMKYKEDPSDQNHFVVAVTTMRDGYPNGKTQIKGLTVTKAQAEAAAANVTFNINGIATANVNIKEATFQLYKRVGGGAAEKVGAPIVKTDYKANEEVEFASLMKQFGARYHVGVVAKSSYGLTAAEKTSPSVLLDKKVVKPKNVSWEKDGNGDTTGEVKIVKGDAAGALVAPTSNDVTIYKNGVMLGKINLALADGTTAGLVAFVTASGGNVKKLEGYSVKVVAKAGGAVDSDPVEVGEMISAPVQAVWSNVKTDAIASWTAVDGAEKYEVTLVETATNKEIKTVTVEGTKTQVSLSEYMNNSVSYYFTVAAVKGTSTSDATKSIAPDMVITARLQTPVNPTWKDDIANWEAVEGAAKYSVQLFRNGVEVGEPVEVTELKADFADVLKKKAGEYTFKVRAISAVDGVVHSRLSDASPVNEKAGPTVKVGKVYNLRVLKTTKKSFTLAWNKAKNATHYKIFIKKNGKYVAVKTVKGTKAVVGYRTPNTTYSVKVKAYHVTAKKNFKGLFSAVKKVKTKK